jgi:hypothetical protein
MAVNKLVLSTLGYSTGSLWFWEDDIEKFVVDASDVDLIAEWLDPQLFFPDPQLVFTPPPERRRGAWL